MVKVQLRYRGKADHPALQIPKRLRFKSIKSVTLLVEAQMKVLTVLGYITAATVLVLVIANIPDIKRYIRINTM